MAEFWANDRVAAAPWEMDEALPPDQQSLQYLTSPRGETLKLDLENEAPAYARILGSFKASKQGLFGFLENVMGKGNVFQDANGEMFVRDPRDRNKVVPFDKSDFSLRDIADFAGDVVAAAPVAALGGPGLVGAAKAAGGGGVGAAIKQGISSLLPGDDNMTMTERAADVAVGAGLGGVGQVAANAAVAAVVTAFNPMRMVGRSVRKGAASPYGQEGERLTRETGMEFSLAQQTGSKPAGMLEGIAARSLTGATAFYEFHQKQLQQALTKLDETLGAYGARKVGPATVGGDVNGAFTKAWDLASALRRTQATVDFGTVNSVSGGRPVIPTDNIRAAINDLITTRQVPGITSDPQKVIGALERWRDSIPPQGYTGTQFGEVLSAWSKGAKGSGDQIADMDRAASRQIYVSILNAAERDLDVAASTPGSDTTAIALRTARDNYKANSDAMREVGESTLAKLTNQGEATPEAVAKSISTMKYPTEIAETMGILERVNPVAANQVRQQVIETVIERAKEPTTTVGASGVMFSANNFIKNLPTPEMLRAYGFSPKAIKEIGDVGAGLERISKREFIGGSHTAPMAMAWDVLLGAFSLNTAVLGRLGGGLLFPRLIAKATLTPQGREAILTLANTQQGRIYSSKVLGSALFLNGMIAADKAQQAAEDFQAPAEQQLQEAQ